MTTTAYDRAISAVMANVLARASSLIGTLAQEYEAGTATAPLGEQAFELSTPVLDYESAAYDAGWRYDEARGIFFQISEPDDDSAGYDDWQELCDLDGIDPYEREVCEHWIVSHWLGEKLAAKGEKVDFDFAGLVIWARTTTGQAICMDYVIQQIAEELDDA